MRLARRQASKRAIGAWHAAASCASASSSMKSLAVMARGLSAHAARSGVYLTLRATYRLFLIGNQGTTADLDIAILR